MPDPNASIQAILSSVARGDTRTAASDLVLGSVKRVTVETSFFPTLTFEPTLDANGQPTQPSGFDPLSWLRPKVTVELLAGPPIVYAPRGEPSANYFLHGLGLAGLAVAALAFARGALSVAKPVAVVAGGLVLLGIVRNRAS